MAHSNRPYRLSRLAEADLEAILVYTLEQWSPAQAGKYQALLFAAFADIAAGIRQGRDCEIAGLLKLTVGSHVVFYQIDDREVRVVRILHGAMDFDRHLPT